MNLTAGIVKVFLIKHCWRRLECGNQGYSVVAECARSYAGKIYVAQPSVKRIRKLEDGDISVSQSQATPTEENVVWKLILVILYWWVWSGNKTYV